MTFLIYFLLLIPFSLVSATSLLFLDIYLGVIFTIVLCCLYFYFSYLLNLEWKKHVFYKEAEKSGLTAYEYLCTKIPERIVRTCEEKSRSSNVEFKKFIKKIRERNIYEEVYLRILLDITDIYVSDEELEDIGAVKLHTPPKKEPSSNSNKYFSKNKSSYKAGDLGIVDKLSEIKDRILKFTPQVKYCFFTPIIFAILYIVAAFDVAYGYYVFVRIFTAVFFGLFVYLYYANLNKSNFVSFPTISALILIVLFNPIISIPFGSTMWTILDILASILCLCLSAHIVMRTDSKEVAYTNYLNKFNRTKNKLETDLRLIVKAYMLDISEITLQTALYSEDPFSEIAEHIEAGYPTPSEFFRKTNIMTELLLNEMNLSLKETELLYMHCGTLFRSISNENDIIQITTEFSNELPNELYCLKNKINYELLVLGTIMGFAEDISNKQIADAVNKIRKSRGYI